MNHRPSLVEPIPRPKRNSIVSFKHVHGIFDDTSEERSPTLEAMFQPRRHSRWHKKLASLSEQLNQNEHDLSCIEDNFNETTPEFKKRHLGLPTEYHQNKKRILSLSPKVRELNFESSLPTSHCENSDNENATISTITSDVSRMNSKSKYLSSKKQNSSELDEVVDDVNTEQTNESNLIGNNSNMTILKRERSKYGLVKLNISGTKFHVQLSTLLADQLVYETIMNDAMYIKEENEFYLERDATVFRFVHSYLRFGCLHLPGNICGPLLELELNTWGISIGLEVQRCCLGSVMNTKGTLDSLHKFEEFLFAKNGPSKPIIRSKVWQKLRSTVWSILTQNPVAFLMNSEGTNNDDDKTIDEEEDTKDSVSLERCPNDTLKLPQDVSTNSKNLKEEEEPTPLPKFKSSGELSNKKHSTARLLNLRRKAGIHEPKLVLWLRLKPYLRLSYLIWQYIHLAFSLVFYTLSTIQELQVDYGARNASCVDSRKKFEFTPTFISLSLADAYQFGCLDIAASWILIVESILCSLFAVDIIARSLFCPNLVEWLTSIYTIVDIVSCIPVFFQMALFYSLKLPPLGQRTVHDSAYRLLVVKSFVEILKVLIVMRIFRLLRRHRGTRVLLYSIRNSLADIVTLLTLIAISMFFFGSLAYSLDDEFKNVAEAAWWALVTMSTVGYGDIVPKNVVGIIVACFCIIVGLLLISYIVPVLVNHFIVYYEHANQISQIEKLAKSEYKKIHAAAMICRRERRKPNQNSI